MVLRSFLRRKAARDFARDFPFSARNTTPGFCPDVSCLGVAVVYNRRGSSRSDATAMPVWPISHAWQSKLGQMGRLGTGSGGASRSHRGRNPRQRPQARRPFQPEPRTPPFPRRKDMGTSPFPRGKGPQNENAPPGIRFCIPALRRYINTNFSRRRQKCWNSICLPVSR